MYNDDDDSDESEENIYPRCRVCGTEFFDDETVRCPSCGNYQSAETDPAPRQAGWVIFTAIVLVFLFLYAIVKH
jgi:ribosomal protein L37E